MSSDGSRANLTIRSAQNTRAADDDSRPDDASPHSASAGDDENITDELELNRRRREVVDFWYSEKLDEPNILPLEWAQRENIEGRITLKEAALDPSNWTGQSTLVTIFKRACYQRSGERLRQLRGEVLPAAVRSIGFVERLGRRLAMELDNHEASNAQSPSDTDSTAARLRGIVTEGGMDIKWRIQDGHGYLSDQGKADYMRRLLDTLLSTLSRASQIRPSNASASFSTSAHLPTSPTEHTLFGVLFVDYEGDEFILPLLEAIYAYTDGLDVRPRSIGDVSRTLEHLQRSNASEAYLARFRRIFPSLTS